MSRVPASYDLRECCLKYAVLMLLMALVPLIFPVSQAWADATVNGFFRADLVKSGVFETRFPTRSSFPQSDREGFGGFAMDREPVVRRVHFAGPSKRVQPRVIRESWSAQPRPSLRDEWDMSRKRRSFPVR